MQKSQSNKRKKGKQQKRYEKPRLIVKSRIPVNPAAWGSFEFEP